MQFFEIKLLVFGLSATKPLRFAGAVFGEEIRDILFVFGDMAE
jgi:hypothetical protein